MKVSCVLEDLRAKIEARYTRESLIMKAQRDSWSQSESCLMATL